MAVEKSANREGRCVSIRLDASIRGIYVQEMRREFHTIHAAAR